MFTKFHPQGTWIGLSLPTAGWPIRASLSLLAVLAAMNAANPSTTTAQTQLHLELQIGGDERAPAYSFHQIQDIAVPPNGDIYVLDSGDKHVRIFNRQGRHVRTFGRQGSGPGEFTRPIYLKVDSAVHVFDWFQNRISSFDMQGQHLTTRRLPAREGLNVSVTFPLRNGSILAISTAHFSPGARGHNPQIAVVTFVPSSPKQDTLLAYHSGGTIWHAAGQTLPWGIADSDFGAAGAWAVLGDSLVAVANGYSGDVAWYLASASGLRRIRSGRLGLQSRPVDRRDVQALERSFRAGRRDRLGRIEFVTPPHWSVATRAVFANDGSLWVRNGWDRDREGLWTWFDGRGVSARRVRLPPGFELRAVQDNRLYGFEKTSDGIPVVRVYRWRAE